MDLYGLTDDVIISKNAGAKVAKKDGQKIIPKHIQKLTKLLEVNDLEDDPGQEQSEARIRPGSIFHEFMIDFTQSPNFSRFIMSCILLNSVLLALEVDPSTTKEAAKVYEVGRGLIHMIYRFLDQLTLSEIFRSWIWFSSQSTRSSLY
eukprot:TRINITY_DN1525_c0_g2_i7.p2 TRINITY_DN1525_c0_g2~~TRINITY_DN1525_c0_g2_i7.p2  ORF type:complete len:148 (-),score=31.50 TRINITY_DN1525_c0_g2_i7:1390-1833(-)